MKNEEKNYDVEGLGDGASSAPDADAAVAPCASDADGSTAEREVELRAGSMAEPERESVVGADALPEAGSVEGKTLINNEALLREVLAMFAAKAPCEASEAPSLDWLEEEGEVVPPPRREYYGRPKERIPVFLEKLGEYWMTYCPDWRFGQLMCNLDRRYRAEHNDCDFFYLEEDEFLAFLDSCVQK